jgi:hypothetical protein
MMETMYCTPEVAKNKDVDVHSMPSRQHPHRCQRAGQWRGDSHRGLLLY